MKYYQFFTILVVFLITSCNQNGSNDNRELIDSMFNSASDEPEIIKDEPCDSIDSVSKVTSDDALPEYFDYMDRESYYHLIKSALRYDKKKLGIGMDSAISLYSDDLLPSDSIIKWWNMIQ